MCVIIQKGNNKKKNIKILWMSGYINHFEDLLNKI